MDIKEIELAAKMFFKMCEEHPDLCPHDLHWTGAKTKYTDDKRITENKYKCGICGKEIIEVGNTFYSIFWTLAPWNNMLLLKHGHGIWGSCGISTPPP